MPARNKIEIIRPPLSRTFDVPTPEDLQKVFEGDHVKLIFKGGTSRERMWVSVTQAGRMDRWSGTLATDPYMPGVASRIKFGDTVHFHPYDVIDIDLHRRIDQNDEATPEQSNEPAQENTIKRPWYKNSQIITTIVVGCLGAIATIVAALL